MVQPKLFSLFSPAVSRNTPPIRCVEKGFLLACCQTHTLLKTSGIKVKSIRASCQREKEAKDKERSKKKEKQKHKKKERVKEINKLSIQRKNVYI